MTTFLDAASSLPLDARLACFDNDGTLWCEHPTYVQYDFLVDALRSHVAEEPAAAEVPEFAALLSGDVAAIGELGLPRIALALTSLFDGIGPDVFTGRVRDFMAVAGHSALQRPLRANLYQPMLELIDELRRLDFTVAVVTGGGTEFVRAVSADLYGVQPELVVGTLVEYDAGRGSDGVPQLRRTSRISGDANEGLVKIAHIQTQLGRRPVLAVGNSGGDREMLEWAAANGEVSLALLLDHDDAEREFRYTSKAETFAESEPITDVGRRLGWTVISMAADWDVVFSGLGES